MQSSKINSSCQEYDNDKSKFIYSPVKALAHTPPYKIHKYFARRPWNVFNQLVRRFSYKNDIILDPFCGGGVTIYEGLKEDRKVIGFDLNPLSTFIIKNMIKKPDKLELLESAFDNCIHYLDYLYQGSQYFENNGEKIFIEWFELCFQIKCNYCGSHISISNSNKISNGVYRCINSECNSHRSKRKGVEPKDCKRIGREYLFKAGYNSSKKKIVSNVDDADILQIKSNIRFLRKEIKNSKIIIAKDEIPMNWDRQLEDLLLRKGIINFQDLFTERNLLINTLLLDYIKSCENGVGKSNYELLRICFSNTVKDTSIMSFTNETWQSGRPVNWSKHAYWIPSQFCEVNIIKAFQNSRQRVRSSLQFNLDFDYKILPCKDFKDLSNSNILLQNCSVADSNIPDNSIDSIITDPPYGSNVQYLELSHFWFVWNKDLYDKVPDFTKEAVSNRKKGFKNFKTMYDYEQKLLVVFSKCYNVLKPKRPMVLTFNNKDISAWLALLFSIFRAGFTLEPEGLYFQDGVKNYKQTAHTKSKGSPFGDFIYAFIKSKPHHPLKIFNTEKEFKDQLDCIFKNWISDVAIDKNGIMMGMFLEAIPLIESFSKSYLVNNGHNLYSHFKKNYLKKIY